MVEGNHNLENKQTSTFQLQFALITLGNLTSLFLCKENLKIKSN